MNVKRRLYQGVVVPTVLYGDKTWNVRQNKGKRWDVFEMKCLRSVAGVMRMDTVRNEKVRQEWKW